MLAILCKASYSTLNFCFVSFPYSAFTRLLEEKRKLSYCSSFSCTFRTSNFSLPHSRSSPQIRLLLMRYARGYSWGHPQWIILVSFSPQSPCLLLCLEPLMRFAMSTFSFLHLQSRKSLLYWFSVSKLCDRVFERVRRRPSNFTWFRGLYRFRHLCIVTSLLTVRYTSTGSDRRL